MALQFVGKIAFPPTDDQSNTVFETVYFDNVANTFVVVNEATGAVSATIGQAKVALAVAALAKADLATPTYIAYAIGTVLAVSAYAGTADGVTLQKTSLAAGTFADWIVIATTNKATTGTIGANPA